MNADRELLELAAKAAGLDGWWSGDDYCFGYNGNTNVPIPWRPITDDGDALRLAVKLGLCVFPLNDIRRVGVRVPSDAMGGKYDEVEEYGNEPMAAIRRAIVQAAAEIGRLKN